jgi:hypothetical protein
VKRELIAFALKALSISLVLGFLWFWKAQDLYPHLLSPISVPFFQWVGVKKWLLSRVIDHFTNIVPYVALVLATPEAFRNWKKTLFALLGGLAILAAGHLLLSWAVYYYSAQYRFSKAYFRAAFPYFLLCDAMPLILWLLFYPRVLPKMLNFRKPGEGKSRANGP